MGILDSIRAAFTRSPAQALAPTEALPPHEEERSGDPSTIPAKMQQAMATIMRAEGGPRKGSAQVLTAFNENPWLRASVGHTAQVCGAIRWRLFAGAPNEKGRFTYVPGEIAEARAPLRHRELARAVRSKDVVPIRNHPWVELMDRPNMYMGGRVARQMTVASYRLIGDAGWILDGGGDADTIDSIPVNAWPVPGTWITQRPTPDAPFFEVVIGGTRWPIPMERMLMFTDPNPANPYGRGIGIGDALADEIDIDEHAAKMLAAFFQNRAMPDAVISLKGAQKSVLERAKREWNNLVQGFRKAYKTHWTSGEIDVKRLDTAFRDMQLVQLRTAQRDVFQQASGIPPEKMGIVTNSNRATALSADINDAKDVNVPVLEVMREEFQRMAEMFDPRLFVEYENPVPDDVEAKRALMSTNREVFKVNTILRAADEDPLSEEEGGEGFMVGGVWYASLKDIRPVTVVDPLAGDTGGGPDGGDTPDAAPAAPVANVADTAMNGAQIASLLDILSQVTAGTLTKPAAKAVLLVAFPTLDEGEVDALLAHIEEGSAVPDTAEPSITNEWRARLGEWLEGHRAEVRASNADAIKRVLRAVTVDDFADATKGPVREMIVAFGQDAIDAVDSSATFDDTTAPVEKHIKEFATKRVGGKINATTRAQLNDALAELTTKMAPGTRAGPDDVDAWTEAAVNVFARAKVERAAPIATTEGVYHSEFAVLQGLRQSGVHTQKEWITTMDGLARDSHESLDAQVRELEEAYVITEGEDVGATTQQPGGFGIPRQDINCRCAQGINLVDDAEKHAALVARGLIFARGTPEEREAAWRAVDDRRKPWEKTLQAAAVAGFDAQERAVRKAIEAALT